MGVQEFASKVLSHPEDYSLTMRKKANFAHADGGPLESDEDNLLAPIIKYYEDTSPQHSQECINFRNYREMLTK
jgi:hypothetical protein